jgi:hypothetical protein
LKARLKNTARPGTKKAAGLKVKIARATARMEKAKVRYNRKYK